VRPTGLPAFSPALLRGPGSRYLDVNDPVEISANAYLRTLPTTLSIEEAPDRAIAGTGTRTEMRKL
jgi:hypothetical protein